MQWIKQDMEQYLQAKEYVDTLIVPLTPFHLTQDKEVEKSAFQNEVLTIFTLAIEKELMGRVLLTPNYNYLKSKTLEVETNRLNSWVEDAMEQPFKHIFFVTFDSLWKRNEQKLNGSLLWLPGIVSGDIQSKEMKSFIKDQVGQISELIKSYWQ